MNRTAPMPSHELDAYRSRLERRLAALGDELAQDRAKTVGSDEDRRVADRKDLAEVSSRGVVDDAEFARDLAEAADIRAALERLADGSFGRCVDCGDPIAPARLQIQPAAARCAACQKEFERHAARGA